MTARGGGTTYAYNGDGTLVSQVTAGVTTRSTQDLASPLTQVLQSFTGATRTDYLYGANRLASLHGSTRTWYVSHALGSERRTVTDAGVPLGVVQYDPWGTVESGTVPTFGFTGELQQGGLVNLRARWYHAGQGRFASVDPAAGVAEQPYSFHPYQYAYADPVRLTDPSGECAVYDDGDCRRSPPLPDPRRPAVCPNGYVWGGPSQPQCIRNSEYTNLTTTDGVPIDIGVVVGLSASCGVGVGVAGGFETVFDLYDLEVATFAFGTVGGAIGGTASAYSGLVGGWSSYQYGNGVQNYSGMAGSLGASLGIGPLSAQGGVTRPDPDSPGQLWVGSIGVGASLGAKLNGPILEELLQKLSNIPGIPSGGVGDYINLPHTNQTFHALKKRPTNHDAWKFTKYLAQISRNAPGIAILTPFLSAVAFYNARAWQDAEILRQRR